jgi:hypothetical protein
MRGACEAKDTPDGDPRGRIVAALAGEASDLLLFKYNDHGPLRAPWRKRDDGKIEIDDAATVDRRDAYCTAAKIDIKRTDALVAAAWREARRFVRAQEPLIRKLAAELVARRSLSIDDVRSLLTEWRDAA